MVRRLGGPGGLQRPAGLGLAAVVARERGLTAKMLRKGVGGCSHPQRHRGLQTTSLMAWCDVVL
jgi:hypothetical protein